jgi:uncharacterized protein YigE (DUF2233 family)
MRRVVQLSFILALLITMPVASPTHWRVLKPGLEYAQISRLSALHRGHLHAFRIDLNNFDLALAMAYDYHAKTARVTDLTLINNGLIGVNGGFFSQALKPLGLRITNCQERNPLKSTSWWGIFYIVNHHPYLVGQKNFKQNKTIEFAVQSGPRIIVDNKISPSLKPGLNSRTAIGITKDGKVILVATEKLGLTTTQLAEIMNASETEGGLACQYALNLDGGSSTQLYARIGELSLDISRGTAVTDAILVIPRHYLNPNISSYFYCNNK